MAKRATGAALADELLVDELPAARATAAGATAAKPATAIAARVREAPPCESVFMRFLEIG
jgi:hypothetical protein